MLYLEDVTHADVCVDGSRTRKCCYDHNSICLVDLSKGAAIDIYGNIKSLAFVMPKSLLNELAEDSPSPVKLKYLRGTPDAVLASLAATILSLFDAEKASPALLKHLAIAVCAHLLHNHSEPDVCEANFIDQQRPVDEFKENGSRATTYTCKSAIQAKRSATPVGE